MKSTSEYLAGKFESDKPRFCYICRCQVFPGTATVDHFYPKSRGGKDKRHNYRLACKTCNSSKGSQRPDDAMRAAAGIARKSNAKKSNMIAEAIKRHRKMNGIENVKEKA